MGQELNPPWQRKPWAHQLLEFERHRDDDRRALLWQMRTGKTRSVLDVACHRHSVRGDVDGLLVLAPNGVHVNWTRRQLPQHMWTGLDYVSHAWQASEAHRPEHAASLERVLSTRDKLSVLTVNSESIIHDKPAALIKKFLKGRRVMLAVDESDDFRTPGSRRTKRGRALAKYCPVRRIMTGTVVSNSPLAAYSQFALLEGGQGALGFKTFQEFESAFAVYDQLRTKSGQSYDKLREYVNLDLLQERIAQFASVVLREDVEDISGIVRSERTIILSPRIREAYNTMLKEMLLELESGDEVEALEGAKRIIKLQQIASGFVVDDRGQVHDLVPDDENPRLVALLEELKGTDGKAIIWCKYHEDIKRVVRALKAQGRNPVQYHGRIHSQAQRQLAIDNFQNDPTVTDFVGQPKAGGRGLELHAARVIMWYSHTFDAIEREQADERATAVGGATVDVVDFVAVNTVDEYILATLLNKKGIAESLAGRGLRDRLLKMFREML